MLTKQKRKSWIQPLIVPALTAVCLAYFALQSQSGRYGLEAGEQLMAELEAKRQTYEELVETREALDQRVKLLSDGTLERDMIDERARQTLNVANDDEIVIMRDDW